MLNHSSSLFKIIIRSTSTTESRLMIGLQTGREALNHRDISEMGWIKSDRNIADGLTKPNKCDAMLNLRRSHRLEDNTPQSVLRDPPRRGGINRRTATKAKPVDDSPKDAVDGSILTSRPNNE